MKQIGQIRTEPSTNLSLYLPLLQSQGLGAGSKSHLMLLNRTLLYICKTFNLFQTDSTILMSDIYETFTSSKLTQQCRRVGDTDRIQPCTFSSCCCVCWSWECRSVFSLRLFSSSCEVFFPDFFCSFRADTCNSIHGTHSDGTEEHLCLLTVVKAAFHEVLGKVSLILTGQKCHKPIPGGHDLNDCQHSHKCWTPKQHSSIKSR